MEPPAPGGGAEAPGARSASGRATATITEEKEGGGEEARSRHPPVRRATRKLYCWVVGPHRDSIRPPAHRPLYICICTPPSGRKACASYGVLAASWPATISRLSRLRHRGAGRRGAGDKEKFHSQGTELDSTHLIAWLAVPSCPVGEPWQANQVSRPARSGSPPGLGFGLFARSTGAHHICTHAHAQVCMLCGWRTCTYIHTYVHMYRCVSVCPGM